MLSVRASPSNSAFDNPNPKRRKRDLDGSHKGFERALIDAYGRDTRVRVSQFQSQTETNLYPGSRYPQQPSWNNPSQPLSPSSQRNSFVATSLSSGGERIPPEVHSSFGLQNQRSQGPSSQFVMPVPSVGLRPVNMYSSHHSVPPLPPVHSTFAMQNQRNEVHSSSNEPRLLMPVASTGLRPVNAHNPCPPPSWVHSNFPLQNLRNQVHRTSYSDFHYVMPVALMGLRHPVNVKNSHPPPEHTSFTLQNQRSSNTAKHQGSYIPDGPLRCIQNSGTVASGKQTGTSPYSGLLFFLLAQGVISLPNETLRQNSLRVAFKANPCQDSLGVEFKAVLPKVRNESVVSARYGKCLPPSEGVLPIQNSCPVVSRNQPGISACSGLLCSLRAQGVISLPRQTPQQESLGVEFKKDLLKVRHESVRSALYGDMPRQCSTCGHRFKCQEEHRKHMDWHVIKNRMSKSCNKKRQIQSRMWFVDTSMWLIACPADTAGPQFKTETSVENKKSDEETAVPADGDQTSCALCGEAFDDFYSDVTGDWMYKDATFLNAPNHRSTEGMDRSELGPILHALCISDGSLRKRLRTS